MRALPFLGTILCLAITTGCAARVEHLDGEATPAGAGATPSTAASPSSPAAATSPSATPASSSATPTHRTPADPVARTLVLGPKGIGTLKLGMSKSQALATGMVDSFQPAAPDQAADATGCVGRTRLKRSTGSDGLVYYSTNLGIDVIGAYGNVRTPEGVGLGSTLSSLLRAYPTWVNGTEQDKYADGHGWVPVPGNRSAYYRINITKGNVDELTLQNQKQDCYE